jgi:hypothetical protein
MFHLLERQTQERWEPSKSSALSEGGEALDSKVFYLFFMLRNIGGVF